MSFASVVIRIPSIGQFISLQGFVVAIFAVRQAGIVNESHNG
ncbi:MAG: hypothetical protein WCI00_09075 [bacterium]